jgi:Kiwa protein KwaB-like
LTALDDLKDFPTDDAAIYLWVFKKRGASNKPPIFTGHWVATTDALDDALRTIVSNEREEIEETIEYDLLAQNNEASALSIATIETHADLVIQTASAETDKKKSNDIRHLRNAIFYAVKLVANGSVLYAIKKTESSWSTRKARDRVSVFFAESTLDLSSSVGFEISKYFDFFIVGDVILVKNKAKFESILSFKQAHVDDFDALLAEPEFTAIFSDTAAISEYVGKNKIRLRRASAIRQKGYYRNENFMQLLIERHHDYGLNIHFNADGRIVPQEESCDDIFVALLDHRLISGFSENIYDVPNATQVVP